MKSKSDKSTKRKKENKQKKNLILPRIEGTEKSISHQQPTTTD